jgi:hypothetical protein
MHKTARGGTSTVYLTLFTSTLGTGSFPGVKRPGRGADQPPPPSAEVENE